MNLELTRDQLIFIRGLIKFRMDDVFETFNLLNECDNETIINYWHSMICECLELLRRIDATIFAKHVMKATSPDPN